MQALTSTMDMHQKTKFRIAMISNISLLAVLTFILIPLYEFMALRNQHIALASFENIASVSAASASDQNSPDRFSILFIGDMMFDRGVRTRIIAQGAEDTFASTTRFLASQFDLAIGNLEGPITSNPSKTVDAQGRAIPGFSFTFPTSTAQLLKDSGIDIVSLANNHADNFGPGGFRETIQWLEKSGIAFFGNAENSVTNGVPSQISTISCIDSSMQSGILDRPYCIGLVGYHGLIEDGEAEVLSEIKTLAAAKQSHQAATQSVNPANRTEPAPDFIIVFPHWGNEYQKTPTAEQKRLAHAWIDAGADMIIGAHPHIVESMEMYKGKPVIYSLGNYMFDQYFSYNTTHGLAVGLEFSADNAARGNVGSDVADIRDGNNQGLSLEKIKLMPIDITNTRIRIASDTDRMKMLNEIARISNGLISTSTKNQIIDKGEIELR